MDHFRLDGKVALLTGASRGIGAAMARALAEVGAKVVVSSRKQESVEALAQSFREQGLEARGLACHVGEASQLSNLIEQTVKWYGGLDIVVNNAAINPVYGPLEAAEAEAFDKIMTVNVKAPWMLAKLALPHLQQRGGGSIINIASVEGLKPSMGLGFYSTSKAALIMLNQNMAKEWGKYGVRANVICPGLVKTRFSAALWQDEKMLKAYEYGTPLGRMADAYEMEGLAVLLASPAGAYITGGVFTADGGFTIGGL
jgi:NAD(P)-dependent dehydrogenase (short-subunit alcohol dehydrogenase family)